MSVDLNGWPETSEGEIYATLIVHDGDEEVKRLLQDLVIGWGYPDLTTETKEQCCVCIKEYSWSK